MRKLVIGIREGILARKQAQTIMYDILKDNKDVTVELQSILTKGDELKTGIQDELEAKGMFVYELIEKVKNNEFDLCVCRLKDFPEDFIDENIQITYYKRNAVNDVIIFNKKFLKMYKNVNEAIENIKKISLSSNVRKLQIKSNIKKVNIIDSRDNIKIRLMNLENGIYDAVLVAKSTIDIIEEKFDYKFSIEEIIPQTYQGIVCIVSRKDELVDVLCKLEDYRTKQMKQYEEYIIKNIKYKIKSVVVVIKDDFVEISGLISLDNYNYDKYYLSGNIDNIDNLVEEFIQKIN